MDSFKNFINKNPFLVFCIMVFTISWGVLLLIAGPDGFPVSEQQVVTLGMAILIGTSVTGVILSSVTSGFKNLLSRLFKWRIGLGWYLVALLIAPLATILTVSLLSIFSAEFFPNIFNSNERINLLIMALVAGLTVGIFEELGWTGFAVPTLLKKHSIVNSGIVVGLIWGIWHFPLFWQLDSFTSFTAFLLLLVQLFSWLPPYRVLMVWVYKNTESLLLVILMHTSLVASLLIFDPPLKGESLLIYILTRALFLWVAIPLLKFVKIKAA